MLISHRKADLSDHLKQRVVISFVFRNYKGTTPEQEVAFILTEVAPKEKRHDPVVEQVLGLMTNFIANNGEYVNASADFVIKMPVFDWIRKVKSYAKTLPGFVDVTFLRQPSAGRTTVKVTIRT